jgi:hypothetical protein
MSSQGGALTQLIALGAADRYLTQNANITYWRHRYNRYTNFAMEPIEQQFNTSVGFGQETQITLNRTGDLIFYTYVVARIPGIIGRRSNDQPTKNFPAVLPSEACNSCGDLNDVMTAPPCVPEEMIQSGYAHYTNAIGQWLVQRASITIGGQVIDTLYADYLYMWEELSGKPGKRLEEMIGKEYSVPDLVRASSMTRRLYIPLPFWFSSPNASGNALPVVSLQFHGIQMQVRFAELQTCIQTSCHQAPILENGQSVQPDRPYVQVYQNSPDGVGAQIENSSLQASIETTYIFLDIEERDRFATGSFEQLITQVQYYQQTTSGTQDIRINLNFNHPVIELIWAVRRECLRKANSNFEYYGYGGTDPIDKVSLKLNNLPRFQERDGRYFRLVQPWQYHTNIPSTFIYVYSFALYPEEPQPSGSCNFSRIDNIDLEFKLNRPPNPPKPLSATYCNTSLDTTDVQVIVFARNYNILRLREGLGGLAFSN